MMNEFPIRRVDRSRAQSVEPLGTKPKFWFRDQGQRMLFKADDRETGEDWAEVVASQLCTLLGLPHVEYELAVEVDDEVDLRPGVVCANMARKPIVLVLGNELLLEIDPGYPSRQRFRVRQHTIAAVCDIVAKLAIPPEAWMRNAPSQVKSALDAFSGYVMLDAWIANQDRHHENWGALRDMEAVRLAPTFDHGAALARNLLDSERLERLTTRDRNRTIDAFASRGRSAFYRSITDRRPLGLSDAFLDFKARVPTGAVAWLDRLATVSRDDVWGILEKVPEHRMTDVCREFTMELLMTNQQRLLE
jgi:hypothetical protein